MPRALSPIATYFVGRDCDQNAWMPIKKSTPRGGGGRKQEGRIWSARGSHCCMDGFVMGGIIGELATPWENINGNVGNYNWEAGPRETCMKKIDL